MRVTDNRSIEDVAEGNIVAVFKIAGGGMSLVLDTGYHIFIEKGELQQIVEEARDAEIREP